MTSLLWVLETSSDALPTGEKPFLHRPIVELTTVTMLKTSILSEEMFQRGAPLPRARGTQQLPRNIRMPGSISKTSHQPHYMQWSRVHRKSTIEHPRLIHHICPIHPTSQQVLTISRRWTLQQPRPWLSSNRPWIPTAVSKIMRTLSRKGLDQLLIQILRLLKAVGIC